MIKFLTTLLCKDLRYCLVKCGLIPCPFLHCNCTSIMEFHTSHHLTMSIHNQSTCHVISKRVACAGIYRQFSRKGAQQVRTVNVGEKGTNVGEFPRSHVKCTVVQALRLCIGRTVKCTLVQALYRPYGKVHRCTGTEALYGPYGP
jgi:hypothetical protein